MAAGWLRGGSDGVHPEEHRFHGPADMLRAYLVAFPAPWFLLAAVVGDTLVLTPEYGAIPSADRDALQSWGVLEADGRTIPAPMVSFWRELLTSAAMARSRKSETDDGWQDAEDAVVLREQDRLRSEGFDRLAELVTRVSLLSDRFGYDVRSFHGGVRDGADAERELHVEVKFSRTASRDRFRCYLTRHEYEVGRVDPGWILALCDGKLDPRYVPRDVFCGLAMPSDGGSARWTETEVVLDRSCAVEYAPSAVRFR